MLAGRLSGDKVELGLVPLGATLMGVFSLTLVAVRHSFALSTAAVVGLAMSSGLFVVPLYAFVQQRSGTREKGRVVAANNFYQTIGMLIASGLMWLCYTRLQLGAAAIMLGFGISLILVTAYIVTIVPDYFVRFVLWLLTHSVFRIRIHGQDNVPFRGPALLVANHVSFVDGFLIGASVQRFIRFMVWKPFYQMKGANWLLRKMNAIPVGTSGPRDVVESIRAARKEIESGHMVCIFAEGAISRTGSLLPFRRGLEKIVGGTDVPIIPVHLDRVWGSIFSFKGGRFFWKRPLQVPYPVTVAFGDPLPSSTTAPEARLALMTLGSDVTSRRRPANEVLGRQFIRTARHRWSAFCMADSTGQNLTFGRALVGSLLLSRWMRHRLKNESHVAILLPASVGGALTNVAASLAGVVPVNLNFTAGKDAMAAAIAKCGVKTTLTSRTFLSKANLEQTEGMVFVEDVLKQFSGADKVRMLITAWLLPSAVLSRLYSAEGDAESVATIIFSSVPVSPPRLFPHGAAEFPELLLRSKSSGSAK
jgi:acyl-[acyl-carrier-protein]-phospholipid O-acyltransferase/long-chain-fatty-acid--[acyl-carrier-protein] ligase